MAQVNARVSVRGQFNAPAPVRQQRVAQAEVRADLRVDASPLRMRGGMAVDTFARAGGNQFHASVYAGNVTGMGADLNAYLQNWYPGAAVEAQVQVRQPKQQAKARLRAMQGMGAAVNVAVNTGRINPAQAQNVMSLSADFGAFARTMAPGGFQAAIGLDVNQFMGQSQFMNQIESHQNMLGGLTMAQGVLAERLQGVETGFGQFAGQVTSQLGQIAQQFGQYNTQFADIRNQFGVFGEQLQAQAKGLADLGGQVGKLDAGLKGLGGVVEGLSGKLSGLDASFGSFKAETDNRFSALGSQVSTNQAATDTRLSGVDKTLSQIMADMQKMAAELKGARDENVSLRSLLGEKTAQLEGLIKDARAGLTTKVDTLEGKVDKAISDLSGRLDASTAAINARIDSEVAKLASKQTEMETALRGQISDLDKRMTTADTALKAELESVKGELTAKLGAEVAAREAADKQIAADLQGFKAEYNTFVGQTREQLTAQSARIDGAFKQIGDVQGQLTGQMKDLEAKMMKAIQDGDAGLQAQLTAQKAELTGVQGRLKEYQGLIQGQADQLKTLSGQVNTAINTANSALAGANDAKALAANLQGQINGLRGDVNQLVANDHSFSALLKQWWGALESWRGGHFLVNQGMSGNAHTRFDPIMLDLKGDGLDLAGKTETKLISGDAQKINWTKANSDDGFLILDATSLREAGFEVQNARGEKLDGNTLFRDGLRIKDKEGKETVITDGWQMLGLFDSNKDGKVNSSDEVFKHLKIFLDGNADGTISDNELKSMTDAGVRDIALTGIGEAKVDALGNTRADGTFTRADGTTGLASDVNFGAAN